ncbi:MAG: NHL repeat-containing protein [Planctomycetes bacterium]|nr:NHL repeat-containing protein [Planctomycetota bacterium]MBI3846081.1 NHL repeat-containing protein [Planctomycetota bacterium]
MKPARTFVFGSLLALISAAALSETPLPVQASGRMYLGSYGTGEVKILDRDGTLLRTATAPGLTATRGIVASSDGRLFVSGEASNAIYVFDADGNFQSSFTANGLNGPTGGAISPDDRYFVCSFNNNSIFIFSLAGQYLGTLTPPGLSGPNCIAFLADGTALVSSALNDLVIRLDANGQAAGSFTGGGLDSPMSVALDTQGRVFVTGGLSNNVVVFDSLGNVSLTITNPAMHVPQGAAFDDQGRLYVSNYSTNDVIEFAPNLDYIRTITATGTSVARSIAFEKLQPAVACRRGNVLGTGSTPADVLMVNGSSGNYARHVVVPTGGPLAFDLASPPGAGNAPLPYVVYAIPRENSAGDVTNQPFGLGEACFSTPLSGGSPITVFNTLRHESRLGTPLVSPTRLGPGEIFRLPQVRAGLAGRRFTVQGIVPECCLGRLASVTNAVVVDIR